MMRVHDSSSILRGHRPYQLAIVLLLVLFATYATYVQRGCGGREAGKSVTAAHFYTAAGSPGSPMTTVPQPPPVCQCNCQCDKQSASSHTVAAAASDNSKALVASGAWSLPTNVQSYGAVPRRISGPWSHMQFVRSIYPPVGPEKGSSLDASYLSTPIAYGTAFVPEQPEEDGMPSGLTPRPACQRQIDILQNHIYKNQHPTDCKRAKLFVRRHMPGYGLYAGLGLGSNYLFLASILGRTLIDLSPNTYFTGNCPTNNLECAFLPLSNCTAADFSESEVCYSADCFSTARVISIDRLGLTDFLPCAATEYPRERCNRNGGPPITASLRDILPELGPHGEQFLQGEYSRYLTRPNKRLSEFAAQRMAELDLDRETIGVHIRHGDKYSEGMLIPVQAYGLVVRRAIQITGIKTVFIGTDTPALYEQLPKYVDLPGIRYTNLDPDANPVVFSANQARQKGATTMGLFLMTQTIIMSQSRVYIGTRSSMGGQIVYAMQSNDCATQRIPYDMFGDLFYNSWYCRNDMLHAGREWMCALEPPQKEDNHVWRWSHKHKETTQQRATSTAQH